MLIRKQLSDLAALEAEVADIDEFSSAEELLNSKKHYGLVFLDIMMPGVNGVNAARALRAQKKADSIVFVTGSKEYVFDAFDVGALHYLLKPIDSKKFKEVFERAHIISKRNDIQHKKLVIRTRNSTEAVQISDIFYVESQLKKLIIHTGSRDISCYGKISEFEKELGASFYRCHRGYLINMYYVESYNGESITLVNGEYVYLAKERYADFVKNYLRYMKNGGACIV